MMRLPLIPVPSVRDTRTANGRARGASRRQAEPSALALASRMLGAGLARVPWRQACLGVVVAAVAGVMPWALAEGISMLDRDFTDLRVENNPQHTTSEALQGHLEPLFGASYFATDLSRVKARIEMLPWVRSAAVGREWPGTLTVSVLEHEPVAHWNGESLVSQEGVVFSPAQGSLEGLPGLHGPQGKAGEVLERARAFSGDLESLDLGLESLRLEARGAWTLLLNNGIRVSLGRDRVDERFQRFMTVYESRLAPIAASINGVDARYGNGVAVRWRDS
ncbi:cell division protein FtsQ [Halospina denitrificans]|uniref:Cell division protein FtsQ n=1 Tax=Halospina denitrificans TaxID=332522 RepID=A0A4R7JKA8_9GAMM|nr:cell division protein FtsQ/DivIB [Halospina denitrificans]TDT37876.1 cell division protein FtsQ [Halospina denitrificans]